MERERDLGRDGLDAGVRAASASRRPGRARSRSTGSADDPRRERPASRGDAASRPAAELASRVVASARVGRLDLRRGQQVGERVEVVADADPALGAGLERRRAATGERIEDDVARPRVAGDEGVGERRREVGKLTGGLAGMAKTRKVEVVRGVAQFLDPHHVEVEVTEGAGQAKTGVKKVVRFQNAIIAAGSQVAPAVHPGRSPHPGFDLGARARRDPEGEMPAIGGGIIGLEMGTVYSTLG